MTLDFLVEEEASLKELDTHISEAVPDEESEAEMTTTLEYNKRICNMRSRITDTLTTLTQYSEGSTTSVPDAILTESNGSTTGQQRVRQGLQCTVALLLLQMPTFSGRFTDWVGFWEHFNVAIHYDDSAKH